MPQSIARQGCRGCRDSSTGDAIPAPDVIRPAGANPVDTTRASVRAARVHGLHLQAAADRFDQPQTRPLMPKEQQGTKPTTPLAERDGRSNVVIIDGSNVALSSEGEKGVLDNILIVRDRLADEGFEPMSSTPALSKRPVQGPNCELSGGREAAHQVHDRAG